MVWRWAGTVTVWWYDTILSESIRLMLHLSQNRHQTCVYEHGSYPQASHLILEESCSTPSLHCQAEAAVVHDLDVGASFKHEGGTIIGTHVSARLQERWRSGIF